MKPTANIPNTANESFKRSCCDWYWYSIAGAVMLHLVLFTFSPIMSSAEINFMPAELIAVEIPDVVTIPAPPPEVARPAIPVLGTPDLDVHVTIAPTTFDANPIENLLLPPTTSGDADRARAPVFTLMTVEPELKNRRQVKRELERNYPWRLRHAGVGGRPTVWFLIDENGRVIKTRLNRSGGHPALDEAAMAVADMMEFSPALNRDQSVRVWVEIPIVFEAR
ncbi:MAG: TonB family protein [Gemmatimonadota bacterium]